MSEQIAVRISELQATELDAAVQSGRYPTRAAAVRAGIDLLLRAEREREIAEEYRRAYERSPQDEWIGEVGLRLGADLVAQERERHGAER